MVVAPNEGDEGLLVTRSEAFEELIVVGRRLST